MKISLILKIGSDTFYLFEYFVKFCVACRYVAFFATYLHADKSQISKLYIRVVTTLNIYCLSIL